MASGADGPPETDRVAALLVDAVRGALERNFQFLAEQMREDLRDELRNAIADNLLARTRDMPEEVRTLSPDGAQSCGRTSVLSPDAHLSPGYSQRRANLMTKWHMFHSPFSTMRLQKLEYIEGIDPIPPPPPVSQQHAGEEALNVPPTPVPPKTRENPVGGAGGAAPNGGPGGAVASGANFYLPGQPLSGSPAATAEKPLESVSRLREAAAPPATAAADAAGDLEGTLRLPAGVGSRTSSGLGEVAAEVRLPAAACPDCQSHAQSIHNPASESRTSSKTRGKAQPIEKVERALDMVPSRTKVGLRADDPLSSPLAEKIVKSKRFDVFLMLLILVHGVQVGIQVDYMADHQQSTIPTGFRAAEVVFLLIFGCELSLRLYVYQHRFFCMRGWGWNVIDFTAVMMQILEEFLMLMTRDVDELSSAFLLRIIRLLRAIRFVRFLRLARLAEELRLLVSCLITGIRSFFWAFMLLLLPIYIFAIYFTQFVLIHQVESNLAADTSATLNLWWGSVPRSMLSLFQALTGGVDWDDLVRPLYMLNYWAGHLFFVYIAFAAVVLMNVITGTFVEKVIRKAKEVEELTNVEQARRVFKVFDGGNGEITEDDFNKKLEQPEVQDYFRYLKLDPSEAKLLFGVMDADQDGSIVFDEFLAFCIRLQGPAKSIDLLLQHSETVYALRQYFTFVEQMEVNFESRAQMLHHMLEQLQARLDQMDHQAFGGGGNENPASFSISPTM